jgi:hypothetical protein
MKEGDILYINGDKSRLFKLIAFTTTESILISDKKSNMYFVNRKVMRVIANGKSGSNN